MRFGRLMAATGAVSLTLAGGVYALALPVQGPAAISEAADGQASAAAAAPAKPAKRVDRVVIRRGDQDVRTRIEGRPELDALEHADLMMFDGGGSQIGVAVRDVDTADVTRLKLAAPAGALVDEVRRDTAAAKAGVKTGDLVTAFDGERVRSARQLERLVEETPAGRTVKLSVMRDGGKLDLDITPESGGAAFSSLRSDFGADRFLAETMAPKIAADRAVAEVLVPKIAGRATVSRLPRIEGVPGKPFAWAEGGPSFTFMPSRSRLGVQVDDVEDQLATYFGVDGGVLVRHVAPESPAAKAGLKAGDVITSVAGKPVKEAGELRAALDDVEDGKDVTLSVTRERKPLSLKATLESPEKSRPRVRRVI